MTQMDTDGCPQADWDEWSEISGNGQELKEKNIYPRMTRMDTDGCPQADGDEWSGISMNMPGIIINIFL